MSRSWRQLTAEQRATVLSLARLEPDRPWADIARSLSLSRWAVFRYLRRHCGPGRPGPRPRPPVVFADPIRLACPACTAPLPPLPAGAGYRCPCGQLIATSHPHEGAA